MIPAVLANDTSPALGKWRRASVGLAPERFAVHGVRVSVLKVDRRSIPKSIVRNKIATRGFEFSSTLFVPQKEASVTFDEPGRFHFIILI